MLCPDCEADFDLAETGWIVAWREHLADLETAYPCPKARIEALAVVLYDAQVATEAEETEEHDAGPFAEMAGMDPKEDE
jgi:hypothetical protein